MELNIGSIFRHFKGNSYIIEQLAKDANTQENMVIYRALYGNKEVWVRSESDFKAIVDINRKDNITGQRLRFEEITEL